MHPDRVGRITFPEWYDGVTPNHQGFPARPFVVLGFDTETVRGYPYTLQVTDGDGRHLWYLRPRQFLPRFVRWVRGYVDRHDRPNVVVFGHYLGFDLPALMFPQAKRFASREPWSMKVGKVEVEVVYGRVCFARLRFPGRRTVLVLDTFAYVWTSLRRAALAWRLPYEKLPKPKGLGHRVLRGDLFERYALRDADLARELGALILRWHEKYDVRLSVSAAQFAARVFTHRFLTRPLVRPPAPVERLAMLSYHGGKNGYYRSAPSWVRGCREYDLKSAYPWAMTTLPDLEHGGRWRRVRALDRGEGFVRVWGTVTPDAYPLLYDEAFQVARGPVAGMAWTMLEAREAVRRGELAIDRLDGYVWEPRRRSSREPWALPQYATHFFAQKSGADEGPDREFYKLLLNSLYGKFINLIPDGDGGERPGGFFFPVLASWITAAVRVRVHALEHDARAIHTATDAVHTTRRLDERAGLGGLECAQVGPCFFLRNKVYFHYGRDGRSLKVAHHGIRVPPARLWKMLLAGRGTYTITHLLRPREAVALGTTPLQAVTRRLTVHGLQESVRPVPKEAVLYWKGLAEERSRTR